MNSIAIIVDSLSANVGEKMKYRLRFQKKDGTAAQARIVEARDKLEAEDIGRSLALGYGIIFRLAQVIENEV